MKKPKYPLTERMGDLFYGFGLNTYIVLNQIFYDLTHRSPRKKQGSKNYNDPENPQQP
ncbi:MAG: hypothetical protein GTN38_00940 [Candidatus Aenigmarchaeota archaeon]|nr:hypothetical protein [Candidatus Aenigmarchaeota archaeon]NIP40153.1 hypothetical protein [Candidatus Aenigmarchaeota archaeon]NIQ17197.1 hypothetical protein [Candidatus Aenigmarchaeota archaeon]NIS72987.1 hypothetical protein [Candidatus Aenigmarchaeota archaeon]